MNIGFDGSLYLNARLPDSKVLHKMTATADGKGGMLNQIAHPDIDLNQVASPKVSHHSSGTVKSYGEFDSSTKLAGITHATLIRRDQYTKPDRFKTVKLSELRATDIIVPGFGDSSFELDAEMPLRCCVFVGPFINGNVDLQYFDQHADRLQSSLIFPATNLVDYENRKPIKDMFYQLTFFNDQLGENPNWTYSSFARSTN